MVKRLLGILGLLLTIVATSEACTFAWDRPATYTDGSPVAATETITYALYFTPVGTTVTQKIAETTSLSTTLTCPAGTYYATATTPTSTESAKSNLVITKQLGGVTLRWSQ